MLGRDRGWQEGICAEFLCKTEWNRWRICSEEIGYFLLLWIVVEKYLGLLNSCCPDNREQRAWAVFKLYHVVASRDVAQCLSWCTPASFHLLLLLHNSLLLLWLFFFHVFYCHNSVLAIVLEIVNVLWKHSARICLSVLYFAFPVVSAQRQRCFGLGGFAEEVNIQVILIQQCACHRKTLLSKDNWCLLPPVHAAKAERRARW